MKKTILFFLAGSFLCLQATAQVKMPQPSPTQTIKQDFGLGTIELTYSRPGAKGRKVFGDLVPYNKLWRTGANAATKIVFSDKTELGGKTIDTGTYVLYTIPGQDTWEIILNKGISNWGTDGYKDSLDICRFTVESQQVKNKTETFTMQFTDVKPESCVLQISWEKTVVNIPISTNIKARIKAQIEAALQTDKKPYWQAAQYYKEYENNLPKALEYCNKAAEQNSTAYWIWLYKAKLQYELYDKQGARASAEKSLELARAAKNEDYIKMNLDLLKKIK